MAQHTAKKESIPAEVFDEYVETRNALEKREKSGWLKREERDTREVAPDGVYYPPVLRFGDGGTNSEESSFDTSIGYRSQMASNPHIAEHIYAKLARDRSPHVRRAAAYNRNAPKDLLEELANDKNKEVRFVARINLDTPGTFPIDRKVARAEELLQNS